MQRETAVATYDRILGGIPGSHIGNIDEFVNNVPNSKWSETLLSLSDAVNPYHDNAKVISKEKSLKASQNLPFLPHLKNVTRQRLSGKSEEELAADFLRQKFGHLEEYGVSFSIAEFDSGAEKKKIEEALKPFKQSGMTSRVSRINSDYERFSNLRQSFHEKLIGIEKIFPLSCLPELLMAAPVFYDNKKYNYWRRHERIFITHGSYESAWLYQIYNFPGGCNERGFDRFDSKDAITPEIAATIEKANKYFNHLIIATPYHNQAEWTEGWPQNIDPFLIGFNTYDQDNMYFLRRWSGTGVFPRVCDMIADTVEHLKSNLNLIERVNTRDWSKKLNSMSPNLKQYASNLINAYERNRLFDFFQGKLTYLPVPAHMKKVEKTKSFLKRIPSMIKNI